MISEVTFLLTYLVLQLYRWGFSKKTVYEDEGDEEGAHIYFHCVSYSRCSPPSCSCRKITNCVYTLELSKGKLLVMCKCHVHQ